MAESKFSTLRFHKLFLRSFFLLALHICFRAKTKSYTILKLHYILFFWPFENSRDFFEDLMKPQIIEIILQSEYLFQSLIVFCLCFTEPVFASLANLLGRHDNLPSPLPAQIRDYKMFDVEIKYGLLQVIQNLKPNYLSIFEWIISINKWKKDLFF